CLDTCAAASCGDGQVWLGVEQCDDGNDDNTDACLDTCAAASCGDGHVWANHEACDDANRIDDDGCHNDCTQVGASLKVTRGHYFTCVLFESGDVKCWGFNTNGQSGRGNTTVIGDNETPANASFAGLGAPAVDIEAGGYHVCALFADGSIMCWGVNSWGQLGYGNTTIIGDNELPSAAGIVDVGDKVVALAPGYFFTCVLTDQQTV